MKSYSLRPGLDRLPDAVRVQDDSGTNLLGEIHGSPALVKQHLVVPDDVVGDRHRRAACGQPDELERVLRNQVWQDRVMKALEQARREHAALAHGAPALLMQPDEDPFAFLQLRRRADAYEFGVRAGPFLEGAQRSSDRVASGARQALEVSLPGGRKSNVGRRAQRFAR